MPVAMLIIGLLLGGCAATVILCCIQINRMNDKESEIRRLRKELNHKE